MWGEQGEASLSFLRFWVLVRDDSRIKLRLQDCRACGQPASAQGRQILIEISCAFQSVFMPVKQRRDRIMVSPNSEVAGKESSHGQSS